MKVVVKLDEGEIKAAVLDWLENNSETTHVAQFEEASVELIRDPETGRFNAVVTASERFDATAGEL